MCSRDSETVLRSAGLSACSSAVARNVAVHTIFFDSDTGEKPPNFRQNNSKSHSTRSLMFDVGGMPKSTPLDSSFF